MSNCMLKNYLNMIFMLNHSINHNLITDRAWSTHENSMEKIIMFSKQIIWFNFLGNSDIDTL